MRITNKNSTWLYIACELHSENILLSSLEIFASPVVENLNHKT